MFSTAKSDWLPDSEIGDHLTEASQRSQASMTWTKLLITEGFPGPAVVWAVRSVEIFLKEFVLTAVFLTEDRDNDWDSAVRKASNLFEKLKWRKAIAKMNEEFGPLDKMTTADGEDALEVWEREIVPARHNIVHGREEPTPEYAIQVVQLAEQTIIQLKLRLIVAKKHPFGDVFAELYEAARNNYHGRASSPKADG